MVFNFQSGCIITGRVTKNGGSMYYVGEKKIPKYVFSVQVKNWKDENGKWNSEFLECEYFGESAKYAPRVSGNDIVLCIGIPEEQEFVNREGANKKKKVLKCNLTLIQERGWNYKKNRKAKEEDEFLDEYEDYGSIDDDQDSPFDFN